MRPLPSLAAVLSLAALSSGCTTPPEESEPDPEPSLDPWVHEIQGTASPAAIASGPDGDLFLGGRFRGEVSFGGGVLKAQPQGSVFLAHLDAAGKHRMSGATGNNDLVTSVAVGEDGSLFAVGSVDGQMSFGSGKLTGTDDAFLTAFSPDEQPRFTRQVSGTNPVTLQHVAVTPQGNVVIAALADATTDLGDGPDGEISAPRIIVAEYGPSGELLWTVRLPISPSGELGLTVDRKGDVYFAGGSYGNIEFAGTSVSYGTFVGKIAADGTPLWIRGASNEDGYFPSVHDLVTDEDDNLYMSGFYYYYPFTIAGVTVPPSQQLNGYVVKMSPDGTGLYAKGLVMSSYSGSLEIAAARGGDLLVGMTVQGGVDFGGAFVGTADGQMNAVLARLGPGGEHVKSFAVDGQGGRYIYDIAADPEGQLVLLGGFDSILDLDGTRLVADSGTGSYVARLAF